MRTKIPAVIAAMVLAIAATVIAANLYGAAATVTSPIQGDPIPGVDVSIEQSPGGIIIAQTQTDSEGNWKMSSAKSGTYLLTVNPFTLKAAKFRAGDDQNVTILTKVGPKMFVETHNFSSRCLYTRKIEVPPGPPQPIEVTVVEGKPCEATPSPR